MDAADTLAVIALAVSGGCLAAVLLVAAWAVRTRRRADALLAAALAETDAVRAELAAARAADPPQGADERAGTSTTYLITDMSGDRGDGHSDGTPTEAAAPARIEGRLFADLVLRESVVKAAALAHGVRRAASPEVRNRVRFEMRREVKRARKQRRADLRDARLRLQAEQRSTPGEDAA